MAKVINCPESQFGANGTVPLFIGDDWSLKCILSNYQPSLTPDYVGDDLTGAAVTAYFPATGGVISSIGNITNATLGQVTFNLPASATIQAMPNSNISFYAVAQNIASGLVTTYQSNGAILEIDIRQFNV